MKELQNIIHRHFEDPKQKKRYLAMFIALSMLVSFMVPLILMEPADSKTGVLACGKIEHIHGEECYIGDMLNCSIQEHIHTEECYKNLSIMSLRNGTENDAEAHSDNEAIPNAGTGEKGGDGKYVSVNANTVDGVTYSPATQKLYTLLFGEPKENKTHWVDENKSLDANLEIANEEFFLGFASDFCAFIENDFEAFDADAEGRVFIGGDLIFNGNPEVGEWNYQVGAGDFGQFIPLTETDEYENTHNFASGIIGGKVFRLGTLTTGSTLSWDAGYKRELPVGITVDRHISGTDIYYYPEEGAYKSFIIGNIDGSRHLDEDVTDPEYKDIAYSTDCNHKYYDHDCQYCRDISDMKTAESYHAYLRNVNELAQFYQYDNVKELLDKTFNTVRTRSSSLATMQATSVQNNDGTLVLDASDIGDAKTAYFKLDDWTNNGNNISKVIIIVPDDRMTVGESIYTGGKETVTDLDLNIIVSCDDEEININRVDTFVKSYARGSGDGYKISNDGSNYTNNHPVSSNILYNFPNATKVNFLDGCNFNGTILAPNADVKTPEKCPGHLSGALIAKSFYGGLEFGYRPYRGGVDVLGDAVGYEVPVDKFYDNEYVTEKNKFLPGAMFAVKDEFGNVVSLFDSTDQTKYVDLPSKIDLSGNTIYKPVVVTTATATSTCTTTTVVSKTIVTTTEPLYIKIYEDVNKQTEYKSVPFNQNVYLESNVKGEWSVSNVDNIAASLGWATDGNNKMFMITGYSKNPFIITIEDWSTQKRSSYNLYASEWTINVTNEDPDKTEIDIGDTVILNTNYSVDNTCFKVTYTDGENVIREDIIKTDENFKYQLNQATKYIFEATANNNHNAIFEIDLSELRIDGPLECYVDTDVMFEVNSKPENASKIVFFESDSNLELGVADENNQYVYKFDEEKIYTIDVKAYDSDGNVIAVNQFNIDVKANDNIDEPANENTSLIIIPEADKDLVSLQLILTDNNDCSNRKVKAKFYYTPISEEGTEIAEESSEYTATENHTTGKATININNCPQKEGYKITKVEIVPVSADTPIDYCVLSYSAPCIEVSRKVPVNQTAQNDIMHILKSFDTNEPNYVSDVYFTVANSEEITDRDGKVECYVYTDGTEDAWHGEAEFDFTDKANVKFENINVSGVTKIVIKPKECEALPISEYTINTLESEAPDTTPKTEHVEEHKYTIEEIQPVEGFFPTDAIYEVTVKETINYESDTVDGKPKAAHAEITAVKKVENEDDVTTFSYSLDISFTDTTKTITIGETVFEMTLDEDRKVTSITVGGETITDVSKPMIIGENDYKYYFNPETKMIVPIPGNHITFTNTPGLLFKKFDDGKNPVKDVVIALYKADGTLVDKNVLSYGDNVQNTHLYNIDSDLEKNTIYYFSETQTNGKYEKPADIYFKIVSKENADNKYEVIYGTKEQVEAETGKVLDFINNRVIEMENIRIGGVKLKIQKLHYGTNVDVNTTINDQTVQNGFNESIPLSGAKFDLFAENGTFIGETTTATDENGLTEFALTNESPAAYVSKSSSDSYYLKPGVYYLAEKEIPEHSNSNNGDEYANPGRIYFTVDTEENNFAVHSGVKGIRSIGFESTGNVGDVTINGKKLDDQSGAEIVGVTKFKFEIVNPSKIQIYSSAVDGHILDANKMIKVVENGQEKDINEIEDFCGQPEIEKDSNGNELKIYTYSATYNPSIDFTKLQIQNYGSSLNIRYIELEDEDGIKYIYSPGSNTDVNNVFGLTNEMLNSTIKKGEIVDGKNDESIANLVIGNKTQPDVTEVSVNKKWAGDEKFEYLREDVKVKLYYSNTKLNYSDIEAANWENVVSPVTPDMFVTTDTDIGDTETNEGESDTPATASEEQKPVEVTLNAANKWKYTWTDLPAKVRGENGAIETSYYYYVREIEGSDRYTPSYSQASDGTHIVTNTLKTVDIPVTKEWNDNDIQNITVPPSLYVHLEWRELDGNGNGTGEFKPVPGKTLVLTDPWSGEFEGLPVGFEYRFSEPYVQNGWTANSEYIYKNVAFNPNGNITSVDFVNTVETGDLPIKKVWSGDETDTSSRPEQLKFKVWRTISKPYFDETDAPYDDEHYTDYERLLQHSLYFYDANMCGTDVSENSALAWRSNCHTEDEVPGGYHDAGDHVMFGLPQGYTASMLGWTYYEFFKNDGENPIDQNEKEHLKVILKRFYDFFVNSVHYDENGEISEILVQKGNGNVDHVQWGPPETQNERTDEMYWRDYGADIAAEYAAALAIGYVNFNDDPEFPDTNKYLEVAIKLYKFAEDNPTPFNEWGVNKDETQMSNANPGFYNSEGCDDDMALAAAWLHLATDDGYYNKDVLADNTFWGYSWNDVTLAALCAKAYKNESKWSDVTSAIDGKIDSYKETYFFQDGWGSARYTAILQMAALVAAKNGQNTTEYKDWAITQMDYILGKNDWKDTIHDECNGGTVESTDSAVCLITNFAPDDISSPQAPHHRAASGWETLEEYKINCGYDSDAHKLIGAMVGGPSAKDGADAPHTGQAQMDNYNHDHPTSNHTYIDDLHDYCCNEVSIDYNAGLVGAAAGLYYFTGTGERSTKIEGVEIDKYGLSGKDEYNAFTTYEKKTKQLRMAFNTLSVMSAAPAEVTPPYTLTSDDLKEVVSQNGWALDSSCVGKSISSIYVELSDYPSDWTPSLSVYLVNAYTFKVLEMTVPQSGNFYIEPNEKGVFTNLQSWDSIQTLKPDEVRFLRIVTNSFNVKSVTINFGSGTVDPEVPANDFKFENAPNNYTGYNVRQTFQLRTNEPANWPSTTDTVKYTPSDDGKSCDIQILKYTSEDIKIKAVSQSDENKSAEVIVKANKMELSLNPSSVNVGQQVTFTVSNISGDGITYEYYYEGDTSPFATVYENPYSHTPNQVSDEKRIYAVVKYGNDELDRTGTQPLTVNPEGTVNQNPFIIKIGGSDSEVQLNVGESRDITVDNNESASYFEGEEDVVKIINNKVIALKEGTVTINAVASDGRKSNDITVTVNPVSMQINNINDTNSMNVGDTPDLSVAAPNGFDGNNALYELTDESKAYAELYNYNYKTIRALKPGEITVKAKVTKNIDGIDITVDAQKVFTINDFTPSIDVGDTNGKLTVNTETDLVLSGKPENAVVTWSIKEETDVARIENNKIYTSDKTGTITLVATIKAKDYSGDVVAKIVEKTIEVTPVPMSLSLTSATIEIKDQIVITANNVPDGYDIVWTADNDKVEITPNGNSVTIVGKKDGKSVITATAIPKTRSGGEEMTATAEITVEPIPVPEVEGTEYYLIHKEYENITFGNITYDESVLSNWVGSNEVSYIRVKFYSQNGKKYEGNIKLTDGENEKVQYFMYENAQGYRNVDISLDNPMQINKFIFEYLYAEQPAQIESIYFYGKIDGPTIVNAPVSMTVGEEVILEALGFPEGGVSWSVDDDSTYASITEDGKLTAEEGSATEEFVTVTITATSKTDKSIVKSVEVRIYPKPNELKVNGENEVTIKYTSSATLTNTAGFDYNKAIIKIGDVKNDDVLTINNGEVSLTDTYKNSHESVSVTIQLPGDEEFAVSNLVTINFVGKVKLSGTAEVPLNYNSRIKIDNAIGDVTWTFKGYDEANNVIKDGETVLYNVEVDKGVYKVIDPTTEGTVLTLYPDGRFKSGNTKGIVDVIANVDGEASDPYQIKVSEIPIRPVIPQEGKELVTADLVLTSSEEFDSDWKKLLENLPIYDEKGNIYYYYVEEYAYNNTGEEDDWKELEWTDGYIYGKNNSKYIPMSYKNNGLDLISLNNQNQNVTIGNKMTGKTQGQMPSSGGVGRTTYYFFGGMIMLLSAAGYTCIRRRQSSRRAE